MESIESLHNFLKQAMYSNERYVSNYCTQWRSKAKRHPRPTIKVPPFPLFKLAYKNL